MIGRPGQPGKGDGGTVILVAFIAFVIMGLFTASIGYAVVAGIGVAGLGVLASAVGAFARRPIVAPPAPPPQPLPQPAAKRQHGSDNRAPRRRASLPPELPWTVMRDRFADLQSRYAAYECDALAVLRMPGLADMSVAETARFVDAFALAQALLTEVQPMPGAAVRFRRAVEAAEAAWVTAQEHARQLAHSALGPVERRAVERVIELLESARDTGSEPERRAAYALAVSELAALERITGLSLPRPAIAALTTASRGRLTG